MDSEGLTSCRESGDRAAGGELDEQGVLDVRNQDSSFPWFELGRHWPYKVFQKKGTYLL